MALENMIGDSAFQKTVSIIGCGWLGFPLAKYLLEQGHIVKGSTTSLEKLSLLEQTGIEPYFLRVTEKIGGDIRGLFDSDVLVINIPPDRKDNNVVVSYPRSIKLILEQRKRLDTNNSSHAIMISSTGVYESTGGHINETAICNPVSDSGKAVLKAESIIEAADLSYTILRMAGLVGGERQPGRWFEGKVDVPGGDTPVNMIHQEDCIRAISSVILKPATDDIYNLCAAEHPVKREFYRLQAQKLSLTPPTFLVGSVSHRIVDNSKFINQFKFTYKHPDPNEF